MIHAVLPLLRHRNSSCKKQIELKTSKNVKRIFSFSKLNKKKSVEEVHVEISEKFLQTNTLLHNKNLNVNN